MTPVTHLARPLPPVPRLAGQTPRTHGLELEVLHAIARYRQAHPWPPTIREIANALYLPSTCAVSNALLRLRAKGLVTWQRYQSRTLAILYGGKET